MPVGHLGRPSTPVWAPGEESPEGPHWQRPGGGAGAARGRGKARLTAGAGRLWADFSSGGAREGSCGAGPPWGWGWTGSTGWGPGNSRLSEMTLLGEAETGQTGSEMQVGSGFAAAQILRQGTAPCFAEPEGISTTSISALTYKTCLYKA